MKLYLTLKKYLSKIPLDTFYCLGLVLVIFFFVINTFIGRDLVGDATAYNLPHYQFVVQNLRHGIIPFWNPYDFWGLPEILNSGMSVFNPFTIFNLLINIIFNRSDNLQFAGNLIEVTWGLALVFGAIGMYLLLRRKFATLPLPAIFSALVFVLCPTVLDIGPGLIIGIAILPWLIWALLNFLDQSSFKTFIWLTLANYYVFTHGYPYYFVFFLTAEVLLVLIYKYRKIFWFGLSYLFSILLAVFLLWPNVHIYSQSFRNVVVNIDGMYQRTFALATSKIVTVLVPRLFEVGTTAKDPHWLYTWVPLSWGVVPLIFLAIGFYWLKKDRLQIWLVALFFLTLLYAFAGYMDSIGFLSTIMPLIAKFRDHVQVLPITIFCGVIILARGISASLKGVKTPAVQIGLWALALVLFVAIMMAPLFNANVIKENPEVLISVARATVLLIAGLILLHLTIKNKSWAYLSIMIFITLAEFFFYFRVPDGYWADYTYDKFYQKNTLIPETPSNDNLFRIMFDKDQFSYSTSLLGVSNYAGYNTSQYKSWYQIKPDGFQKIKNANVKYVVTTNENWEKGNPNVELVSVTGPAEHPEETFVSEVPLMSVWLARSHCEHYIYRIKNYLPRFYLPAKVEGCISDDCWEKQDPPNLVMVKGQFESFTNPPSDQVSVKVEDYQANLVRLRIKSNAEAFIVGSETWDKDWSVKVNGKKTTLYNVSNGIRGVFVPAGESEVVMTYFPSDLIPGIGITFLGIILLLIVWRYALIDKFICGKITNKKGN